MQTSPSSPPALPQAWTQVLDKVDETLRRTAEVAAEREQAIANLLQSSTTAAPWHEHLRRLQEQMPGWSAALRQSEKEATEADTVLSAGEDPLRRWLSEAEALEQRLAKWVSPEV